MSAARRVLPDAMRRGWCPGLARPMPTGDGLLARLHPPLGRLSAAQLRLIAGAARRFGNGHVDVTARANLQIRGVTDATAGDLAALLTQAGLGDVRSDGGPQRLTLTSPLLGLDPGEAPDVLSLARTIEAEGRAVVGLPAKTLVAIEGPGVPETGADFLLRPGGALVRIALADAADGVADVPASRAPASVVAMLRAFAALKRRRVRDLSAPERQRVLEAAQAESVASSVDHRSAETGVTHPACPSLRGETEAIQEHADRRKGPDCFASLAMTEVGQDRIASPPPARSDLHPGLSPLDALAILTVEAPFGRCTAAALDALAEAADRVGAPDIRTTPERGFVLAGSSAEMARAARDALAGAGFVTEPGDPRRAVVACPGAPACRSGSTPVPEHAARLAQVFAPFAARGLSAHVSGCAKGCAHPGPADLTLVAEEGAYRVALSAAPAEASGRRLTFETALERVRSADPSRPLVQAFQDVTASRT